MNEKMRAKLEEVVRQADRVRKQRRAGDDDRLRRAADLSRKMHALQAKTSMNPFGLDTKSMRELTASVKKEAALLEDEADKFSRAYSREELARLRHEEAVVNQLTKLPPVSRLNAPPSSRIFPFPVPTPSPAPDPGPSFISYDILPPALSVDSPTTGADDYADSTTASLSFCSQATNQGGPLGIEASVEPAWNFGIIRFALVPPFNGSLYVNAEVHLNIGAFVTATDHWYTSTYARARVILSCQLFQFAYSEPQPITVLDEEHEDSSYIHFTSETYHALASLPAVVSDSPVLIEVTAAVQTTAISDSASAAICPFGMIVHKISASMLEFPRVDVPY